MKIASLFIFCCILNESFGQITFDTLRVDTFFTNNGKIKEIRYFTNFFDYRYSKFHPNGITHITGFYTDDFSDIYVWELWDIEGLKLISNGQGEYIDYFISGRVRAKGKIENQVKNGKWLTYHENGVIQSVGYYKENKKNGLWKYYFDNGKLNYSVEYLNYNPGHRYITAFDKSGKQTLKEGNGMLKIYYPNGILKSEGPVKNYLETGFWSHYHTNGDLYQLEKKYYKKMWFDGIKDSFLVTTLVHSIDNMGDTTCKNGYGYVVRYDENLNITCRYGLRKSKIDSYYIEYYENGEIKTVDSISNYKTIKRNYFHPNGQTAIDYGVFRENDYSYEWYPNGQLRIERIYTNDSVYTEKGYYLSGKLKYNKSCFETGTGVVTTTCEFKK